MENNISIIGTDCCGCANCSNVCPQRAILMTANYEGFLYPEISDKCIDCGVCLKVCPQMMNYANERGAEGYAAISKDTDILQNASSGGVWGTIAKHFLSTNNSYICAASFVDGEVKHIITKDISEIRKCQGSKYVQSNLNGCFKIIKDYLKDDKRILFCGTPCQVAALYSFLKKRPLNLFTIDLICHGVPSPTFLKKDLEYYCKDVSRLKNVRFRWKNPRTPKFKSGFFLYIEKNNKSELYSSGFDPYFSTFMNGESFRLSCYQCKYANLHRVGDITIGDFDSWTLYPNFHPNDGKSTVIINTPLGGSLWNYVDGFFDYICIDINKEAEKNHQLQCPFDKSSIRDRIYKDVNSWTIKELRKNYAHPSTKRQRVLFMIQEYLPCIYKSLIKNL